MPSAKPKLRRLIASAIPLPLIGVAVRTVYHRIEPELTHLSDIMPHGGTALDIGGWFGPWSQRMRAHAAHVVTLEAHPQLAELLRRTFKDITVLHAAASEDSGEIVLIVPKGGPSIGISSVEHGLVEGETITVPKVSIDLLGLTDVRFIKLDIEGHELAALHGGEKTIKRDRPVLLIELEERLQPVSKVVSLLEEWGYTGYVHPEREWVPLAQFDLPAHQAAAIRRVEQSFVRRLISPRPRYVNMVLFK